MNQLKNFFSTQIPFLFIIIIFIIILIIQLPGDPDLGWHLKNGEYLINHQFKIPATDLYSYTMSDFPVVMHEWLTDIIMFFLYKNFGLISLVILYALITAMAFCLVSQSVKTHLSYQMIAVLIGVVASQPVISVRAQMITLLGLALIIFIIYQFKSNTKSRLIYYLPLVFLIWVNLHGGFSIGLFFIFLFLAIEFFKTLLKKSFNKHKFFFKINIKYKTFKIQELVKLLIIFIISIIATLINPYHLRIYYEVFTTAFDTFAKGFINEWAPLTVTSPMSHHFLIYSGLMALLLIFSFRKIDFTYFLISIIFFLISISSWRHLPFFILISIPYWVYLVEKLSGNRLLSLIKQKWLLIILLIILIIFINQKLSLYLPIINSPQKFAQVFGYPYQAIEFLKTYPQGDRMFNDYNWGGYLIWQYPEKKVFIDGRMPSWRLKRSTGETQEILKDFVKIRNVQDGWDKLLLKYQIDFTLIYTNSALAWHLENQGWQKVYQDNLVVIFKKN